MNPWLLHIHVKKTRGTQRTGDLVEPTAIHLAAVKKKSLATNWNRRPIRWPSRSSNLKTLRNWDALSPMSPLRVPFYIHVQHHEIVHTLSLATLTQRKGSFAYWNPPHHSPVVKVQLKCDGTRWRTGGEVKGKLANGVGGQYSSHYLGTWCIQHYYRWGTHLGCR